MAAGIYYGAICNNVPDYNCDPCEALERARIRNSGFIAKDYYATLAADPTNPQLWIDGIDAGKIFVIPETHGEMPLPSPKMGPGFGNTVETLIAYDFQINIFALNFRANGSFWNEIKKSQNFYSYYSSETQTYISTNTVTIIPGYVIADDLTGLVNWQALIKWQAAKVPEPFTSPGEVLTTCFDPA